MRARLRRLLILSSVIVVAFTPAAGDQPSPAAKPRTEFLAGASARSWSAGEIDAARKQLRLWLVPTVEVKSEPVSSSKDFLAGLNPEDRKSADVVLASLCNVSVISGAFASIEDWRWRSLYLRNGGSRLLVVHRGHGSNPFEGRMIELALAAGYDVIAMTMPMVDWNRMERVKIKTWDGDGLLLNPAMPSGHSAFQMIDTGYHHFVGFFISPVMASIDQALAVQQYNSVSMMGLSGGGWTTALSAAADDRIKTAVSIAGTLPFFARQQTKDLGDAEQYDSTFYSRFPWPMLYQMAATPERRFSLIYNSSDPCCFDSESARLLVKFKEHALDSNYDVSIVKNDKHSFDPKMILELLEGR